ncbi:MAG: hypothetical protein ISS52_02250 [Dehalococcoidia bacterium]|nr:hypothetical protein [Dehalococcoidia bacterium]
MKAKGFWCLLILSLVMMLGACAPAAAPEAPPLVGCKAELSAIYPMKSGGDFLVITPTFTIQNPNPYLVSVEGLTYKVDTGEGAGAYGEIPYRYSIPAGEEITLEASAPLVFMDFVLEGLMNRGLTKTQAGGIGAAVWKGLGGTKPALVPQEAWDMLPARPVTYSVETTIITRAQGMEEWESATGTWPPPGAAE